ncbi:GNAT family N-acetyltransferase [Kineococcus sp. R86509]|uniref:GNAT family N-acetyltransferase n=1 Tax=Kineococcus sp. R86509 TaxID=3093851 RepID=UPI0036D21FBA
MNEGFRLVTPRLLLRRWTAADREPFAELNADPEVMRHFPAPLDRAGSDALAERCDGVFEQNPFGLSAVERREDGRFLGFTGLHHMRWYPDDVEIGWRLSRSAWGQGFATEAASMWVGYARDVLRLRRLISIIHPDNAASFAVARKLGMTEGWRGDSEERPHVVMTLPL